MGQSALLYTILLLRNAPLAIIAGVVRELMAFMTRIGLRVNVRADQQPCFRKRLGAVIRAIATREGKMKFKFWKRNSSGNLNITIGPDGYAILKIKNDGSGNPIAEVLSVHNGTSNSEPVVGSVFSSPFDPFTEGHLSIGSNGMVNFGPGGNNPHDTNLYRLSAAHLQTDSSLTVGSNAQVNGSATVNGNTTTSTLSVGGFSLHMSQGSPSPGPPGGGPSVYTPSYESQMSACLADLITRLNNAGVL